MQATATLRHHSRHVRATLGHTGPAARRLRKRERGRAAAPEVNVYAAESPCMSARWCSQRRLADKSPANPALSRGLAKVDKHLDRCRHAGCRAPDEAPLGWWASVDVSRG
eukprot:scaffold1906_cov106-Isochrysis_galbana.AAC.4